MVFSTLILYPPRCKSFPHSIKTVPFRSVCQGQSAEILKKSGCVQFPADKAVDFVAHGFPAGGAEMERHLVGGVADFLHQGGRRRVLDGWSVAALRHEQGDGLALSAGAVAPLRGGDGAGDRHAGVIGHRLSFHRSSKLIRRRGGALCATSAPFSRSRWSGGRESISPPLRAVQKPLERKAYKVLNVHASPLHLPPFLPGLLLLVYGGIGVALHLLEFPQIVPDGLVLLILGCVLLVKPRLFLFPRMSGDFTSRGTVLVQLPAGHVERPQLALMLPLEVFPLALPLDTLPLVIDGLGVSVKVNKAKQFLQFIQTFMLGFHGRVDGLGPLTLGGDMGL